MYRFMSKTLLKAASFYRALCKITQILQTFNSKLFLKILRNKTPIASERFSTIWAINIATEAAVNTDADVDDAVDVDADA